MFPQTFQRSKSVPIDLYIKYKNNIKHFCQRQMTFPFYKKNKHNKYNLDTPISFSDCESDEEPIIKIILE
jgi:hypothetical protein